jgi:hypothetical protein
MLSLVLGSVPPMGEVISYADNVLLMATTEHDVVSMTEALSALKAHPVGRLRPKAKKYAPGQPIKFLGHRLIRQGGKVRIEPTERNQQKFATTVESSLRKLRRLDISSEGRKGAVRNLKRYIRSWTAAFGLCDGIEELSIDFDK